MIFPPNNTRMVTLIHRVDPNWWPHKCGHHAFYHSQFHAMEATAITIQRSAWSADPAPRHTFLERNHTAKFILFYYTDGGYYV